MASAFDNLASRVMRELISDFGLTVEQAAGILGNLGAESGLQAIQELRPTVAGSRGGFGWAQWTGPRRVAFERWGRERGLDLTSYEANYGYLRAELSGLVSGFDYRHTVEQLKKTATVKAATETFEAFYEKAGVKAMGSRIAFAERAMRLYAARGVFTNPQSPREDRPPMPLPAPLAPNPLPVPLPNPDGKPWYLSKTVIGGILAIALPVLSAAFPALKLVDPNSAADLILKIIQVAGPVFGGALAIFGRVQATQPIANSVPAVRAALAANENAPSPQTAADVQSGSRIMAMPLEVIAAELPTVIEVLAQLNQVAASVGTPSGEAVLADKAPRKVAG